MCVCGDGDDDDDNDEGNDLVMTMPMLMLVWMLLMMVMLKMMTIMILVKKQSRAGFKCRTKAKQEGNIRIPAEFESHLLPAFGAKARKRVESLHEPLALCLWCDKNR